MRTTLLFFTFTLWAVCLFYVVGSINDEEEEPHPDPNDEDYSNMIYIGRMDDEGKRVGFEYDNGSYIVACVVDDSIMQIIYSHIIIYLTYIVHRYQIHIRHWL